MLLGLISHYFFGLSIFFTSLFLVLLVLVQRGRGGGIAGALGGAGGQSAFGTKAGDLFTRITVGVAAFWIFLCCGAILFLKTPEFSTGVTNKDKEKAQQSSPEKTDGAGMGGIGAGSGATGAGAAGSTGAGTIGDLLNSSSTGSAPANVGTFAPTNPAAEVTTIPGATEPATPAPTTPTAPVESTAPSATPAVNPPAEGTPAPEAPAPETPKN